MKWRQAKKIRKWAQDHRFYDMYSKECLKRAVLARWRREKRSLAYKNFATSLKLAKMVEDGSSLQEVMKAWIPLRISIRKRIEGRKDEDYGHCYTVMANRNAPVSRKYLQLDLEYYSDRWCDWRVGVIDLTLEKLCEKART